MLLGGDSHGVFEVRAWLWSRSIRSSSGWSTSSLRTGHGVKRDRAHLSGPTDDRHLGGTDLIRVPTRRESRSVRSARNPALLWNALLVEGVAAALLTRRDDDPRVHALRPALERRRPLDRTHDPVANGEVVLDDVELVTAPVRLVLGKITRSGLDTRSRPPASTITASDAAMPEFYGTRANRAPGISLVG